MGCGPFLRGALCLAARCRPTSVSRRNPARSPHCESTSGAPSRRSPGMSAQKGKRTKPLARLGLPSGTAERSEERAGGERPGLQRCSASPTMRQTQFNTTPRHHSTCPVGRTGQAGQPTVAVVGRPWSVPAGAAPGRAVSVACPQPADHSAAFCEFVVRHAHPQEK